MSATFTLAPEFEDVLVTALQARFAAHPTLSHVHVESGPLGDSAPAGDRFHVGVDEGDESINGNGDWWASGGYGIREDVLIHCEAVGFALGAGADQIRAARDRAFAICDEVLGEVLEAVDPASNHALLLDGRVSHIRIPGAWRERRYSERASRVGFDIRFTGKLPGI